MSDLYDNDELIDEALSLTDKLFGQLLPTVPKAVLSLDISMRQLKILFLLYVRGTMRMTDIASALDISLPAASNLADRLVERGHALREGCAEDRRVVFCRLSEEGTRTVGHIWHSARRRCRDLLRQMEVQKLQQLIEALDAMYEVSLLEQPTEERCEEHAGPLV